MKRNYLIKVQYDGTAYSGWQRQDNTNNTIEEKLTKCLCIMTKEQQIEIHGSGRTDAGVHANGQYANVHLDTYYSVGEIKAYLNRYLPEDICVLDVCIVDDRFHARLSAVGKKYVYTIDNNAKANVFLRKYAWNIKENLDVDKMRKAAAAFVGQKDFATFSDMKSKKKSTIRTVNSIEVYSNDGIIKIEFVGNGFLYHMVRKMTVAIVSAGMNRLDIEDINRLLDEKNRQGYKEIAPAKGLSLFEVYYDI